jgi:hypothetical protein
MNAKRTPVPQPKYDLAAIKAAVPEWATKLAEMMVNDAFRMYEEAGISFEDALPTVAAVYELKNGLCIKVLLGFEMPDDEDSR